MNDSNSKGYTRACAEFAANLEFSSLPAETVNKIKLFTLDWLGCAVRGASTHHAVPAREYFRAMGGAAQAGAVGEAALSSAVNAAFFNAYMGHIMEMDDVDRESISHPGTVVIPAALAVSQWLGKDGKEFITAVAAGYEVMLRIGAAITPAHYAIWHTTGTTGVFGAAAAAGRLLGLNAEQMAWALGNAGTMAAGLWQFLHDGAASKFLHTAKASADGVTSALLAAKGFTGAVRILEGEKGFFAGYARQEINDAIFRDFGTRFRTETVSIKPYPCCRHTHSAIDAANEARQNGTDAEITAIDLQTYKAALAVAGIEDPKTPQEAKFSLRYTVARAAAKGLLDDSDFTPDLVHDTTLRALMLKVTVSEDPELSALMPENWPARVTVRRADGSAETVQVNSPKGDPGNPVTWDEAVRKFRLMVDGLLDEGRARNVLGACSAMETLDKAHAVMPVGTLRA